MNIYYYVLSSFKTNTSYYPSPREMNFQIMPSSPKVPLTFKYLEQRAVKLPSGALHGLIVFGCLCLPFEGELPFWPVASCAVPALALRHSARMHHFRTGAPLPQPRPAAHRDRGPTDPQCSAESHINALSTRCRRPQP
jgi:hypothetical protein